MKKKHWQVSVFDKSSETIRNDTLYTTDTEVYLTFELIDKDFKPDSATVTTYNIYGTATINESVDIVNGIVNYEMPVDAIEHSGGWRTQVVFTKDNEDYTTTVIDFDVDGHLLDNNKPTIVYIENWNSFIKHGERLVDDWEQLEKIRQANERKRESAESIRKNIFETNETERQNEFEENEQGRQSAESVRVSNEEERELNETERISKDSERDSKIEAVEGVIDDVSSKVDSKANKSMLLSPKYDLVYDSCVRDVNTPLDAYSVPMESGHYFENVEDRDTDTTLTYEPEGVLLANLVSNNSFSPVLIENFEVNFPYINVKFNNVSAPHFRRLFYIKYLNKQSWIRVEVGTNNTIITTCIDGVETEIGSNVNPLNNDFGERFGLVQDVHISYRQVHTNTSPSNRAVVVRQSDRESFLASVPTEVADLFNNQGKVGFDVQSRTEILNFKAGRAR